MDVKIYTYIIIICKYMYAFMYKYVHMYIAGCCVPELIFY